MTNFNWICPHCNRAQTVVDERKHRSGTSISVGEIAEGDVAGCFYALGCSNPECNKLTIEFSVRPTQIVQGRRTANWNASPLYERRALPSSAAIPQPDYIPKALVEDYLEACLIRDDSPKAAATLARRCIQGIIRDFCKIAKGRLVDEINALRDAVFGGNGPAGVTIETVEAIDHVRSIGNIGAHMEKDIDLIIPVDPGEAQALIELIEMLFEEWYVARDVRQQKLLAISRIGADKKQAIADGRATTPLAGPEPIDEQPDGTS